MGGSSDILFKQGSFAAGGSASFELAKDKAARSDVIEIECEGPTTGTLPILARGRGTTFKPVGSIDFAGSDATWVRIELHGARFVKLGIGTGLDAAVDYWVTGKDE